MRQKKERKKSGSWTRRLSLERLSRPEYQRDDGGLNVKLCSPQSSPANQDQGPGNVCELLLPSSLELMCWRRSDPFYPQQPARGRRDQAVADERDWPDGPSNRVSASRRILFLQLPRLSDQESFESSCVETARTSFTGELLRPQRHLTGSAPGLPFPPLAPALIGCAL